MGSVARRHHHMCAAVQAFEIDVPDPGDVGTVGSTVIQADQEIAAAGEVDGGPKGLVESGRVLGKDEVEFPTLGLEALLPAESGAKGAEAGGDERRVPAERVAARECLERLVAVVQASERELDTHAADAHRQAFEPIELDVGRGQVWRRAGEISIWTAVHAVVAD